MEKENVNPIELVDKYFQEIPENECKTVEANGKMFILYNDYGNRRFFELVVD